MIWVICMILYILFWHWMADFVAQTHEMAINKSSSVKWLTKHVIAYGKYLMYGSLPLLIYGVIYEEDWSILVVSYVVVNMILHWITDYFTSKWSSKLWKKGDVHNFFVVIGLDQLIHTFCLILTYQWLVL